jgi:hypothetical protein
VKSHIIFCIQLQTYPVLFVLIGTFIQYYPVILYRLGTSIMSKQLKFLEAQCHSFYVFSLFFHTFTQYNHLFTILVEKHHRFLHCMRSAKNRVSKGVPGLVSNT